MGIEERWVCDVCGKVTAEHPTTWAEVTVALPPLGPGGRVNTDPGADEEYMPLLVCSDCLDTTTRQLRRLAKKAQKG